MFPWQLRQSLSNRFRFFWLISFHYMWMLFLSSFINFYLASNLLWSFLCFSFFSILAVSMATAAILENEPIKAQLHMAYDIPTRFHKVCSRHLREICRTNFWRKKERNERKERKKERRRRIIRIIRNGPKLCLADINIFNNNLSWTEHTLNSQVNFMELSITNMIDWLIDWLIGV